VRELAVEVLEPGDGRAVLVVLRDARAVLLVPGAHGGRASSEGSPASMTIWLAGPMRSSTRWTDPSSARTGITTVAAAVPSRASASA
jgi:hypothetical protein